MRHPHQYVKLRVISEIPEKKKKMENFFWSFFEKIPNVRFFKKIGKLPKSFFLTSNASISGLLNVHSGSELERRSNDRFWSDSDRRDLKKWWSRNREKNLGIDQEKSSNFENFRIFEIFKKSFKKNFHFFFFLWIFEITLNLTYWWGCRTRAAPPPIC